MKTEFKMGMKVNTTFIMIMLFYSFLTFFVGPMITTMFLKHKFSVEIGFLLGFVVSLLLWVNLGKKYYVKSV